MPLFIREEIQATTSILADIQHVDREIEATVRRIRELEENRRALTEELEELRIKDDEEEESAQSSSCQNEIDAQVPEEQAPREQRSTEVDFHTLAKEAASSSKKEEPSSYTSLLVLRSQDDMVGGGLVQNQVHSRVA